MMNIISFVFFNRLGPLKHKKLENSFKYDFEFYASVDNTYVITPLSDVLLFTPPSAKVIGENDCQDSVVTFNGAMGKVLLIVLIV